MSQSAATVPATAAPRVLPEQGSRVTRRARRKALRPFLMVGGVVLVIVASAGYWLHSGRIVSIDDAYVRAAKLAVSTDVSGIVSEVAVKEGQHVNPGDVLFRLDQRPFQIALAGAKANMAQVALSMDAMKRDYQRMLRDSDAKNAQVQSDQASFARFASLIKGGGVTRSDYDDARFRLAADQASVESLQTMAQVQLARLGGAANVDVTTTPLYLQAKAQVDEAQRQLDHTVVLAPFEGIVTQVDSLQPGMYLAASTAAFGLVSTERVWVEASPKETDLTYVKPGDHVDVSVDTYPGRVWDGVVESIAPASGAEFSVLPPQNASGNWVKVVQRIPLRVRVDRKPGEPELRAGMSVVVDIDSGHIRHFADLIP